MNGVSRGVYRRRLSHSREMEVQADAVRDWSKLPPDMLVLVFAKLGAVDVLMGAGLVCHSWVEAAKEPSIWRNVDMEHHDVLRGKKKKSRDVLCAMAKAAVDRSKGELEVFAGSEFVTDQLLEYIAERPYAKVNSGLWCSKKFPSSCRQCSALGHQLRQGCALHPARRTQHHHQCHGVPLLLHAVATYHFF
ncbi:F-box protein SKIP19-like isoform X2 [Hordeum vulgare subsp. vulgare]|uniref:F-box protein SKIP19-like isoform X2 n=1 Tax=Hordeum vulgare subsp. vulgare TaxID=112509 RepID=UPI001D1A542F|nr:F-box protein SKIP19-like isoform X2 [Hordeum vulgare subsp. vulgare]